jgi:iron complex transport system permease protein
MAPDCWSPANIIAEGRVDAVARNAGSIELPLGVLTAALGTPVFLWLLAFGRRTAWS